MKNEMKMGALEAMSLINPEYVEAAVYPAASAKHRFFVTGKMWKSVVAAAAAVAICVTCVGFAPQVKAFADRLFNSWVEMNGDVVEMEGTIDKIHIKDSLTFPEEDQVKQFRQVKDAEKYLGVKLLHSKLASKNDAPTVTMTAVHRGQLITIEDEAYCLFHETIDDEGNWQGDGEDAYGIRYEARFLTDRSSSDGYIHSYPDAEMQETYTTANGLKAGIFIASETYHAVLYHDSVEYVFAFTPWRDDPGNRTEADLTNFKAFLDTLR